MPFFSKLLGKQKTSKPSVTASGAYQIARPVIGFINLLGESGEKLIGLDKFALGTMFDDSLVSNTEKLNCNVLFLYCKILEDGSILGTDARLRDLIKNVGAKVAVVASENDPECYFKALELENDWRANLVLLIDRKGEKFREFFQKLFDLMMNERSMLMAWVDLAPQIPNMEQPECPEAIMLPEAGHITFEVRG
jgi:hypothetical protein